MSETRKLDQGLPRVEMRSPALIARQVAAGLTRDLPRLRDALPASRSRAEVSADAVLGQARREAARIVDDARAAAAALKDKAAVEAGGIVAAARAQAGALVLAGREGGGTDGARRTVSAIIRETAERHGLTPADITGPSRTAPVSAARRAAVAAAYVERPDLSTTQLGRLFGDRDHSTIIHAVRQAGVYRGPSRERGMK